MCRTTGWDQSSLTAQQMVQIQDAVPLGSTPVTRNEIEEPQGHQVIRIKPPDWCTRHPLALPRAPRALMSKEAHDEFCAKIHLLVKRAHSCGQSPALQCAAELEQQRKLNASPCNSADHISE